MYIYTTQQTLVLSHQFYVRELLGDGKRIVADGQHVPLDGRLGLCLKSGESLGRRGVDFDQRLLILAQHRQPPDQTLTHLANRLPVNLMDGWMDEEVERAKGREEVEEENQKELII